MQLLERHVLFGANRRSDHTVIEFWFEASAEDCAQLASTGEILRQRVSDTLCKAGISRLPELPPTDVAANRPVEFYARLVGIIALALQQTAGHRVQAFDCGPASGERRCWLAVEYEHGETGLEACKLALLLLARCAPEVPPPSDLVRDEPFAARLDAFLREAPRHVLPRDTQAIVAAAARLDIPCVKLERDPYQSAVGDSRIRPNGLLRLGHACHQRVVDGTFPIDSNATLAALVHDYEAVTKMLDALGLRRPGNAGEICRFSRKAREAAQGLGFPVCVKPKRISRVRLRSRPSPLGDLKSVQTAAQEILQTSPGVFVEAWVPGPSYKLIVANGAPIAVLALEEGAAVSDVTARAHPATFELARRISRHLNPAVFCLTFVSRDIEQDPAEAGTFVDLDVAPAIDAILQESSTVDAQRLLDLAAEGLLRFLFPLGTPSRIPLVAVTGTNGKTTTSALIERAAQCAGLVTGRAGTTGCYVNGACREFADMAGGENHYKVLESPEVQFAVLETARGAALNRGLMYDRCNVAVCTNVTTDHLGLLGIDTVPQMAGVKEFIAQRAQDGLVLNADNEYTADMATRCGHRRLWLTSLEQSLEQLRGRFGPSTNLCLTVREKEREWIEYVVGDQRQKLVPVDEVPITFGGKLRFNVANALQACAACLEMGLPPASIHEALTRFLPDFENSPGRMNFYHGLPFTVLFDYAHNEAGHLQLAQFVQTIEVQGRRILNFSASASWSDQAIMDLAKVVAGYYDLYLCRSYPQYFSRQAGDVGALLARGLREAGVPADAIAQLRDDDDVVAQGLQLCRSGDLMVFCCSTKRLHQEWETITGWRAEGC